MSTLLPSDKRVRPRDGAVATEVEARPFRESRAFSAHPGASSHGRSKASLTMALAVGAVADGLQVLTLGFPITTWIIDLVVSFVFFGIFGFRKALMIPIIIELIPGLSLAPTWTIAAIMLHATAQKAA